MNTIPWYRSSVFTVGLTAAVVQMVGMLDATFIEALVSGKPGALAQLGGFALTALVVGLRSIAAAQPLTLTQNKADLVNAAAVPTLTERQGGFVRPLLLAWLLAGAVISLPAVLQGCTQLGLQQPQTFNQRYAYALGQVTAIRQVATSALNAKQISIADAEYTLKVTDQSRQLLDAANSLADAGDIASAEGRVALVTGILTQLQNYLNSRRPQ